MVEVVVAGGYSGREIEEERGERRERIDMILGYIIFYCVDILF